MTSVRVVLKQAVPEISLLDFLVDDEEFYIADKGYARIDIHEDLTVNVPLSNILCWSRQH